VIDEPPAPPGEAHDLRNADRRSTLVLHLVIIVAGLAVYANAIGAAFVFDDVPQIVERSDELSGDLRRLFRGDRRPATTATLAANHALGGLDPRGYHAVNVLLHIAAAGVLFGLVRRIVPPERGATMVGFAAALLWVVHPLQTEAVTYVIQRAEVMAALAMLVVLYAVLRAARGRRPAAWWAVAFVACALGMASKPTMIVAPVIALLFDGLVVSSSWREALRRRGALHAALACTWLVLVATGTFAAVFGTPGDAGPPAVGFGVAQITPMQYLATQPEVIVHYLTHPRSRGRAPDVLAERRERQVHPVLAVLAFTWCAPRLVGPTRAAVAGAVVLVAATTALGARTVIRNQDYRTSLALWTATVEQVPHHRRARLNLGVALHEAGRVDEAIELLADVVAEHPNDVLAQLNYGSALAEAGRVEEAVRYLGVAAPQLRRPDALLQLADTLRRAGRPDAAVEIFERVIERAPSAGAYLALGNALTEAERIDDATASFEEAAALARAADDDELLASALYNLGNTHFRFGAMDEAASAYRRALEIAPTHDGARRWLAEAEARREGRE